MLSSLPIIQEPAFQSYTLTSASLKKRSAKQQYKENSLSSDQWKTQDLKWTPSSNKYESTNSTTNCDDEELRIHSQAKLRLRLKLKRSSRLTTADEQEAALCLISLKRRYQTHEEQRVCEKSQISDQINKENQEQMVHNQQENSTSEPSLIIKLPTLIQLKQQQQTVDYKLPRMSELVTQIPSLSVMGSNALSFSTYQPMNYQQQQFLQFRNQF